MRLLVTAATVCLCAAGVTRAAFAQSSACLPTDATGALVRGYGRSMAVTTDTLGIKLRTRAGFTAMDSTKVVVSFDSKVCAGIVAGINAFLSTPGRARQVHVVVMGTQGFLALEPAFAPANSTSEYNPVFATSRKYVVTISILGF